MNEVFKKFWISWLSARRYLFEGKFDGVCSPGWIILYCNLQITKDLGGIYIFVTAEIKVLL